MMTTALREQVTHDAPLSTWFGIGGRADAFAKPQDANELLALIDEFEGDVRVLGDGANLLVCDDGVDGLVVSLERFNRVETTPHGEIAHVQVGAGANLPRLIIDMVRDGWAGLEGLGGIPASVGGAVRMNAGGAFGEIADVITSVSGVTRTGESFTLQRDAIPFGYRHSGLEGRMITEVELTLHRDDPGVLRDRLKEVMAYKKKSQPMAEKSAGCVFRNPTVGDERVSAGKLIDECGCKGMRIGGAEVSQVHGNFLVTKSNATTRDVIQLIDRVRERVESDRGVRLETELVIWRRRNA